MEFAFIKIYTSWPYNFDKWIHPCNSHLLHETFPSSQSSDVFFNYKTFRLFVAVIREPSSFFNIYLESYKCVEFLLLIIL